MNFLTDWIFWIQEYFIVFRCFRMSNLWIFFEMLLVSLAHIIIMKMYTWTEHKVAVVTYTLDHDMYRIRCFSLLLLVYHQLDKCWAIDWLTPQGSCTHTRAIANVSEITLKYEENLTRTKHRIVYGKYFTCSVKILFGWITCTGYLRDHEFNTWIGI